ncbi:expressed unknown protein [Seminavis robusta]|uniref:Uncharacterized protein n=1 Tax=Seminavis robusta TaxID=568900 RepID=A0A9N8DCF6_9STRA|nr:expressed unknown protein [Seminavis robusta]|eukprot:Sro76_g041621.1  (166) ;mRNA; f:56828-57325
MELGADRATGIKGSNHYNSIFSTIIMAAPKDHGPVTLLLTMVLVLVAALQETAGFQPALSDSLMGWNSKPRTGYQYEGFESASGTNFKGALVLNQQSTIAVLRAKPRRTEATEEQHKIAILKRLKMNKKEIDSLITKWPNILALKEENILQTANWIQDYLQSIAR